MKNVMDHILFEIKGIQKIYNRNSEYELKVLKGINLIVHKGEFISIIGKSGSGKSTLMNIIGMLDMPTFGEYYFEGQNVFKLSSKKRADMRREKIGFIFQNFELFPDMNALKNIEMPMIYSGVPKKERIKRANLLLGEVGISDRSRHLPNELSGGQKQRVAIARALANKPSLILADEPTGALDYETGLRIIELLKNLNRDGNTIILITHDHEIADAAQRQIVISDGQIINEV